MKGDIVTSYTVISNMMQDHPIGTVITDDDLDGLNVEALIAGGHIEPARVATSKKLTDKE